MVHSVGSTWKRWDLHFHTPSSYDAKKSLTNEDIIKVLEQNSIQAVAITDHLTIDIDRIKDLRKIVKERKDKITIFPGVELRTDKGATNVHIIGIFDNDINLDNLKNDFEYFKNHKAKNKDDNKTMHWNFEDIKDFVQRDNKGILTVHAGKKSNGIDDRINTGKNKFDNAFRLSVKQDYLDDVDMLEGSNVEDVEGLLENVICDSKKPMAAIVSSDYHGKESYRKDRKLWIKADTTYLGLLEALKQPDERFFVGEEPEKIQSEKNDGQSIIDAVFINKLSDQNNDNKWFSNAEIKLNSGLVSIIGNKGAGKSALSDMLGLAGGAKTMQQASFLTKDRFNNAKHKWGEKYNVFLKWKSGVQSAPLLLSDTSSDSLDTRLQYLPQKYIESLCNDLDESVFQNEINRVLFSYIPDEEKGNNTNFDDFINSRTESLKIKQETKKAELKQLNDLIIATEDCATIEYKTELQKRLTFSENKINELKRNKPEVVQKPSSEEEKEKNHNIEEISQEIIAHEEKQSSYKEKISKIIEKKAKTLTIINKLKAMDDQVKLINAEISDYWADCNKENHEEFRVILTTNVEKFETIIKTLENKRIEIDKQLNNEIGLIEELRIKKEKSVKDASEALKEFQLYEENLKKWESKIYNLEKNFKNEDSVSWIKDRLKFVDDELFKKLDKLYKKRKNMVKELYSYKEFEKNIFMSIYEPVEKRINAILKKVENDIQFQSIISFTPKTEKLIEHVINRRISGIFQGIDEGNKQIKNMVEDTDPLDEESVIDFVNKMLFCTDSYIEADILNNFSISKLKKIIKDKSQYYNSVCDLEYLNVNFNLTLQNRKLNELSAGERGMVLLVFYLALNREKTPLVIDQPEDNLDNQSIYTKLVPCVMAAKKQRQVIIVTHNPNIAVACDSEQIIVANINKTTNSIKYSSGSLENREINNKVVEILEGTEPAFKLRKEKYLGNNI